MAYFWPLILVVASNTVYHICAKSLPESVDPLASLTVTYLIGSIFSGILYFVTMQNVFLLYFISLKSAMNFLYIFLYLSAKNGYTDLENISDRRQLCFVYGEKCGKVTT